MYTRCPECRTAFRITVTQLKAADGLVRCGRCDSVFRADLHVFAPAATGAAGAERAAEGAPAVPPEEQTRPKRPGARPVDEIPVVSDASLFQARRRGVSAAVWALGALAAGAVLVGQFAYFYRQELAQVPALQPALEKFCDLMRCEVRRPVYTVVPELTDTQITAHPRYADALRLRASFVNRTDRAQPLPRMQVSLTDSNGRLLARRTFSPREYLPEAAQSLEPNVMIHAQLDISNPDEKATGYEIHLFPPRLARRADRPERSHD